MSSFEYAEMIEMPVSSCEMVVVSDKKKKSSLRKLMGKVNGKKLFAKKSVSSSCSQDSEVALKENEFFLDKRQDEEVFLGATAESLQCDENESAAEAAIESSRDVACSNEKSARKRKKFSIDVISAQVAAIFILAVTILVTNIFWQDSGLNNLFKSVFSPQVTTVDDREYSAFAAVSPSKSDVSIENGVMTVLSGGALYSPADGTVESVVLTDGKYTVTVNHSDKFKTVITGADYSYAQEGEKVFTAAPVCYSKEGGAQVAMYGENALISGYVLEGGSIVWQS